MERALNSLDNSKKIEAFESFKLAQIVSKKLRISEQEEQARNIIIKVLDNWINIPDSTKQIWADLIEAVGFYPYIIKNKIKLESTASNIRTSFFESDNLKGIYLHEEQKYVLDIINSTKNVIVSAPTSFGKSLLIEEIVASNKYKNLVIIQPTLALLDETRKKLQKYNELYKIIIKTSQEPSKEKGNIFLLTAERVMEYRQFPNIEFLILDEFYKLSAKRDDERSDALNNAFYQLLNRFNCRFYLLGPNIDNISEGFSERYNATFYKTKYSLVINNNIDFYTPNKDKFGSRGDKRLYKESALFELLETIDEQTIIYCSSPEKARELANSFLEYLKCKKHLNQRKELPLLEWIRKHIHPSWSLIDLLHRGIGVHDAALQRHISSTIIQYFNENLLKYLFCTTTIIEGVNTSAKNVIFFHSTKGNRKKIDYFDYSNIKGRSGRLMIHYIGNMYNFNPQPPKENVIVDIPFFEQNPVSDEILININDKDLINKETQQYLRIQEYSEEEKQLFKQNGISIQGQKRIVDYLDKNIKEIISYINWTGYPKYEQLKFCLELAWEHLFKEGESKSLSASKATKLTFDYFNCQNINVLVKNNYDYLKERARKNNEVISDNQLLDNAIREIFQIFRHWFQYKIPKFLIVMDSLQKYVCQKYNLNSGDYLYFASCIENDFIRNNLSILTEYGIPKSAINKLTPHISSELSEDLILKEIRSKDLLKKIDFLEYEKQKINENLS